MTPRNRQKAYKAGLWAETLCALILRLKGYRILARRFKSPVGEIDLIARRGAHLVFVEVKVRHDPAVVSQSISPQQQDRIRRAASSFLAQHQGLATHSCRFDAMFLVPWRSLRHVQDAWQ